MYTTIEIGSSIYPNHHIEYHTTHFVSPPYSGETIKMENGIPTHCTRFENGIIIFSYPII